ncbi:MAG: hypothetical protein ACW991_01955 [Candidatus Hodarchaeales archaeon]|jgi:hypothetical protein
MFKIESRKISFKYGMETLPQASELKNCADLKTIIDFEGNYRVRFEVEKSDKIKIYWVGKRSKAYND